MEIEIQYQRGQYRILSGGKVLRYAADYGEIIGTKGADGDPIDVYRGLFPNAETVFIINQYHSNGAFDEHKIMLHFYDEAQAKSAYELTCETPVRAIVSCTPAQLNWWLQYGNHKKPITAQSFPFDSENQTMTPHPRSPNWANESQTAAELIYAWRKTDDYGELTEPATLDSIVFDELADGAEIQDAAVFDALAVANKRLERTAQLLGNAFNRVSGSLKVVENGIQISAPMKKNGTTNIAVMFEMTDGQVVSVLFHNPDTTPAKITPDDVLVSWKWLLNRKDITIVVAKEDGKDLPLPVVARRVMALVEKNTARFAKANANKAAETELLAQLEAEKAAKLAHLAELNALAEQRANKNENDESENSGSLKNENQENWVFGGLTETEYKQAISEHLGKLGWDKSISTNIHTGQRSRVGGNFSLYNENNELIFNIRSSTSLYDITKTAYQLFQAGSSTKPVLTVSVIGKTPKMVAEALNNEALKQIKQSENTNSGSLNDENNQEIDIAAIDTNLSNYMEQDDENFKSAVEHILKDFQGKYVNTVIGKVLFNSVSSSELKLGTKENKIRAALIPFVPQTLQQGQYLGRFELDNPSAKSQKKGKFVAFHNFGNTVVIDNKEINHVVKVGERENGEFVFIAYHSRAVLDSTNGKEPVSTPDTVSNIKAGRSEVDTSSLASILRQNAYGVNAVFDDIQDGKDGWNIEIVSIRELENEKSGGLNNEAITHAVKQVLVDLKAQGEYPYHSTLQEKVGDMLNLSDEQKQDKDFSRMIYDINQKIEYQQQKDDNELAKQRLNLSVGDNLGTLVLNANGWFDGKPLNDSIKHGYNKSFDKNKSNPAKQQAIDFLNDIINGKIDGMADGILDRLFELVEPFEDDDEINELAEKASAIIENAMPKNIE